VETDRDVEGFLENHLAAGMSGRQAACGFALLMVIAQGADIRARAPRE
jgi:hypothetical protein